MQSLVRAAPSGLNRINSTTSCVRLHAWQWQVSMEARSKQLPDLHGGQLVLISGWGWVNACRGRFTVMCRKGFSWPHLSDGDAAHMRLQLTPGQATERLIFITTLINKSRDKTNVHNIHCSIVTTQSSLLCTVLHMGLLLPTYLDKVGLTC